ncbi:hypothetical protein [uncultured Thermomonospora sp.]|mgnify:CR=1 FL=1|uniref:hypothetical protein n=1 Tax=uncultured Thermomonospora sp. TaxID=671175 RepID=UPI00259AFEDC|nr:hypothetical protein [uncultured Thermomonospora sp.]
MAARKVTPARVTLIAPAGTRVTVAAQAVDRYIRRGYQRPARRPARRPAKSETPKSEASKQVPGT